MEATNNLTQATETPQISTETAETAECIGDHHKLAQTA